MRDLLVSSDINHFGCVHIVLMGDDVSFQICKKNQNDNKILL